MKIIILLLWQAYILLCIGYTIQARTYDYSATTECLDEPWKVQYHGGIIRNPEFDDGVQGWTMFGRANIEERTTTNGNKFIAARNRSKPSDGFSQRVQLEKGKLYAFSAWIRISEGSEMLAVIFRSPCGKVQLHGGTVIAQQGCWSMLKGGIVATFSGPADLTFVSKSTTVEIWADNISLQPFTKKQWRSHQDQSIAKVRKRKVKFHLTDGNNISLPGATITLKQTKPGFPIGCEMNENILNHTAYQNWFTSRFTVTTFGNELKWYSTEKARGKVDYSVPDAMLHFCEQNNIAIRGHNIIWANPQFQPTWVKNLNNPHELRKVVKKRIKSVVLRYKGKFIAWDVVNENLHFRFFEDNFFHENASAEVYAKTHELDKKPILFMNEYHTIESSHDEYSAPGKYANKLKNILSYHRQRSCKKNSLPMGIGLQARFGPDEPNIAYMRAGMDLLASIGFPLWLTEVFIDKGKNQVECIQDVLREGYSYPAVQGIVIWPSSPFETKCKMCLTDRNFKNTPNGDVVDKFITEAWRPKSFEISSNRQGFSEALLLHGDYVVTVRHPSDNLSTSLKLKVTETSSNFIPVQLDVFAPSLCEII